MEIFPMCIWLVTELSPYAYGHCKNSRMHTRIMCNVIPICKWGSSSSLYTYWELSWSPYAYRDYVSCNPCMQTGISIIPVCIRDTGSDLDPHMHTGIMHRCANNATLDAQIMQCPMMFFCVCTQNGFWCAHSKSSGSTRDSRKDCWYFRIWSPYAYGDYPYAYGDEGKNCIWGLPACIKWNCANMGSTIEIACTNSSVCTCPSKNQWVRFSDIIKNQRQKTEFSEYFSN